MPHLKRPELSGKQPVLVTMNLCEDVPNLRRNRLLPLLTETLRAGNDRFGFRLCHYVVMGNHLHLIVEAQDARALARGMQGLSIRLARRINRANGRRGRFFADRYHQRVLRSPREVHTALTYVLFNLRKHAAERQVRLPDGIDAFSSLRWLDAWRNDAPVARPRAWLLSHGWKRCGPVESWS